MKKLSDKNKKILIISLLGGVCIVLIISILTHFKTTVAADTAVTSSSAVSSSVTASLTVRSETEEKAVSVQPKNSSSAAANSSSSVPTDQPVQNLQPKVSKPKQPTDSEIKNPSKKPSSTNSVASKAEQGGETKNGQVYLPGFGWVNNNGGGGEGTTASDMRENGNTIADMN